MFQLISSFDRTAKIAALRGVAHSAMARAIGAAKWHLSQQKRLEAQESTLDERNSLDENTIEDTRPIELFNKFAAVAKFTDIELQTLAHSKWDLPLSIAGMLEFMTSASRGADEALIEALAAAIKVDKSVIKRMQEVIDTDERTKLKEMLPEIRAMYASAAVGDEACFTELTAVETHQLMIKVISALRKEKDKVLARVLKTRCLTELGSIPLIEDAESRAIQWLNDFDARHLAEIEAAIIDGATVTAIEEL